MPKLDRNGYAPSLLQSTGCYLCKRSGDTVRHEVFFGPNRAKSKEKGLWVTLCPMCHQYRKHAIHRDARANFCLKRHAQMVAMDYYGWDTETFIKEFGRNYVTDDTTFPNDIEDLKYYVMED